MELSDEVRAALARTDPLDDEQARDLLGRLLEALEQAEDRVAEVDVAAARAEGAALVEEATRVRERILRDLARRRRDVRREVAQLQAGRDRLLEAFASARQVVDDATRELNLSLAEARLRAADAAREAEREPTPSVEDLEEEVAMARLAGLPLVDPEGRSSVPDRPVPEQATPGHEADRSVAPEAGGEVEAEVGAEDREGPPAATEGPAGGRDPEGGVPAVLRPSTAGAGDAGGPGDEAPAGPASTGEPDARGDDDPVERLATQRLKRALADEQNEVLDRVRTRDKRRKLTVDAVLGGDLDRIARYRDALLPVLVESGRGEDPAQVEVVAADAAEAVVRGTRGRVEAVLAEAVDGRQVDEDVVNDGIRACFREWKTQWIGRLAADSVALAGADGPGDPWGGGDRR